MSRAGFALRLYIAGWRDLLNTLAGYRCQVTGDRVHPIHRPAHEANEHPTDGPCLRL